MLHFNSYTCLQSIFVYKGYINFYTIDSFSLTQLK